MPVYSERLAGPAAIGASNTTQFTVPTGRVYVVRQICIAVNATTAVPSLVMWINSSAGAGTRWFKRLLVGDETYNYDGRWVFAAGETSIAVCGGLGAGQTVAVSLHGYNLAA